MTRDFSPLIERVLTGVYYVSVDSKHGGFFGLKTVLQCYPEKSKLAN